MNNFSEWLYDVARQYGFFLIGGATGAVIHRLRNKMTIRRFLASIIISIFVSFCVGIIARDYFMLKESIVYVLCGISGVFSDTILDEIKEILEKASDFFKAKFNITEENKEQDIPKI